ncbi:MAG: DUF1189 family protein [Candidatus Omnitrophica bacterium]|nr:DUF1189 family protein [Candidatus Omnitrophota bacterium]
MNKKSSFWLAPVFALFSPGIYREAVKSSAGRGVLYALYMALIGVAVVMAAIAGKMTPQADVFVGWLANNLPVTIWTPAGLSLENGKTTEVLTHPRYGAIAVFDMTKTAVTEADMGKAFILVTATKVFIKRSPGQIQARDITGAGLRPGQQLPAKVRITGAFIEKFYQNIKGPLLWGIALMLLIPLFLAGLLMGLFYSLVGLLFNLMRTEKLGYGAIFNLTCFAMTTSIVIFWLKLLTPIENIPWPWFMTGLINLGYMFFAFKVTDKKREAV